MLPLLACAAWLALGPLPATPVDGAAATDGWELDGGAPDPDGGSSSTLNAARFSGVPAPRPLPWGRGQGELTLGLGGSYTDELGLVEVVVGGGYFVADGLELGAMASQDFLDWRDDRRIVDETGRRLVPSYALDVTPFARLVVLRRTFFSPYVLAGVGPTVLAGTGGADVFGHWTAMPGAWIGLSRRVSLELAVRFSGPIPIAQCEDLVGEADFCTFQWKPRLSVTVSF